MSGLKVLGISDLREGAAAGVCAGLALPELNVLLVLELDGGKLSADKFGMATVGAARRQALGHSR